MSKMTTLSSQDYFRTYLNRYVCDSLREVKEYRIEYENNIHEREARIVNACLVECARQHASDELLELINGYVFAMKTLSLRQSNNTVQLDRNDILTLGCMVKPNNMKEFRKTPVTFANMKHGLEPYLIEHTLGVLLNPMYQDSITTDEFVKEFLDIHPFEDGNGRVAFIIYNLKNGTMDIPQPLPDYFKEQL